MQIKNRDDYKNERLELLMEAVGNSLLEGELCPNCFEQCSLEELRQIVHSVSKSTKTDQIAKSRLRDAIEKMKTLKSASVLTIKDSSDELIKEYICKKCQRSYLGELNLIANLSETQVLSFFGYDDKRSYKKDFYSFSLIDESYDSFVKELWEEEVEPSVEEATLNPRMIQETTEDAISGEVLGMLKRFFVKFSKAVYSDIGSKVGVYSVYQAGTVESGRREGVPASGADAAMWIGPMTKEDMALVNDYVNQLTDKLPVLVGNGVILQAKKENGGKVDRKQIADLLKYASIEYKDHEYLGVPGKLFLNYSVTPPFVTVLSCDYTYHLYLYSKQLPPDQQSISFPMSLRMLAEHAKPITLPAFVESYLSGKIGTPLLMLQDVFATPGPKLIVGLPPELLRNPSPTQQSPLSAAVDRMIEAIGQRLEAIEQSEMIHAEEEQDQYYRERPQNIEAQHPGYATTGEQSYEIQQDAQYSAHQEQSHAEQQREIEQQHAEYEAQLQRQYEEQRRREQERQAAQAQAQQQMRYMKH